MNKFLTKIIGASLAIAMMIGVGVGLNANKAAKEVDATDSYTLVTNVNNLEAGDHIIIGNAASTSAKFMSATQNSNNRGETSAAAITNGTVALPNNCEVLTLGQAHGNWTLYANNSETPGYLHACSSSSNNLRTRETNADANSEWTISIANSGSATITAQGNYSRNLIRYNSSSKIFSCYASGQQTVYIFKKDITGATVTEVSATINDGEYYADSTLSASDFNLTVTWSDSSVTHPTIGFTWTVNGVENGALSVGNNVVVVTFQNVSSSNINVTGLLDTRWNTEFATTPVADIELPASGDTQSKYYVVAKITAITDTSYGNGNAVDADNTTFAIYGMRNLNGNLRYYQMSEEQKPVAGDVVVLYGVFTKYNNAPEIKDAWVLQRNGTVFEAPALTGITLNRSTIDLKGGEQFTLVASPTPADANLGEVSWSSNKTDVATVDATGKVTAVNEGTATITATSGGFNATCTVNVVLTADLDLSTDTTTSASATLLTWNVENRFALKAEKASATTATNNYYPGTANQNYTSTRFYKNSKLTLTPDPANITAIKAEFLATTDGYATKLANSVFANATAAVSATNSKLVIVTFTDGLKPFVATISDTCGFTSVELVYSEASARQKIEYGLTTQTQLSYRYTGNAQDGFQYSDISIRFGANITKALWDELDTNEHVISGFGVIIADGDFVTNAADMASAMSDVVSSTVTTTFTQEVYAIDYFVPIANKASTIGEDANNYFWNLRWAIDEANMDKMYSAVAYIKVGDEYVLMNMARESVETLALDYLTSRGCNETTAEGSLQAIVDNAA